MSIRIIIGVTIVVVGLCSLLIGDIDLLFVVDLKISHWVQSMKSPLLDSVMVAASPTPRLIAPWLAILIPIGLIFKGFRVEAVVLFLAMMVSFGSLTLTKALVSRPRPDAALVYVLEVREGFSFPSGHVLHYTVFFGLLTALFVNQISSVAKKTGLILAVLFGLMFLGFMRIYLGVHWVSDVLAGYLIGAMIICTVLQTRGKLIHRVDFGAIFLQKSGLESCAKLISRICLPSL